MDLTYHFVCLSSSPNKEERTTDFLNGKRTTVTTNPGHDD